MGQKKSFLLRIDEELWRALEKWAHDELRSVNGQIEYVLTDAVARRRGTRQKGRGQDPKSGSQPE